MTNGKDLLTAVRARNTTSVRAILLADPSLGRMKTENGTIVLTAVYYGATDALKEILERVPEDALNTYEAAATGNARRLKTILGQSRVRVNEANPEGFTPLGLAAFFGHVDAVKALLELGADVNRKEPSRFANTALDAAVSGDHAEVVRVLLAAGGNPNVRSEANYTPLHKAAAHGNPEIVRLLLDHGADPKAIRDGGNTPLADAKENGHSAVVELLTAKRSNA
ncbi:MAG: ankyrin repeat domain-containing protein [Thermoplasmata archaeon]|nr:ankyrin repeat domain-containing protein [Thermoplasmata archaeon]